MSISKTRQKLVDVARQLFAKNGMENTTMNDIAMASGKGRRTLYTYFKSKEDIYNSIVVDYLDVLLGELSLCIEANNSFEDSYYQLCDCLVSFCEQYPKYFASFILEDKATNSRKRGEIVLPETLQELYSMIEALLVKGQKTKVLKEDLEIGPTVLYIWSSLSGIIQISERKKKEIAKNMGMTIEEYRRFAFRTLYSSLIKKGNAN